jgi:RimJ/RimL family protein N-acetyltransferase
METPRITTSHLSLRSFTLEDTGALHKILRVPDVLQHFPSPDPSERDRVVKLIDQQIEHWQDYGNGWSAIERLTNEKLQLRMC